MREPPLDWRGGIGEGIRTGLGILSAFKEAVEETLQEAVDRGDLSAERARQTMRELVTRAQGGIEEARERLDLVPRPELDQLRAEVARLRERVAVLEAAHRAAAGDARPVDSGTIDAPE